MSMLVSISIVQTYKVYTRCLYLSDSISAFQTFKVFTKCVSMPTSTCTLYFLDAGAAVSRCPHDII